MREQHFHGCGFWERQWRKRFLLTIPVRALHYYIDSRLGSGTAGEETNAPWAQCWELARGNADLNMGRTRSTAEVERSLGI